MPGNGAKVRARRSKVTLSGRFFITTVIRITCSSLSPNVLPCASTLVVAAVPNIAALSLNWWASSVAQRQGSVNRSCLRGPESGVTCC